jgi:TP901 family phage tail tape measure protein
MGDNLNIVLSAKIQEQSITGIETQIKQLQDRINKNGGIKLTFDQNLFKGFETQIETTQRKIQKVFQDSKISDLGYANLQQRIKEINASAQEQAKITVQTYKNTKNIKSATIEYVDAAGKAVKETMAWTSHLDKAENTIKKVFQTTGYTFTDNVKKAKDETIKLNQQLDLFKQKMLGMNGLKGEIDIFAEKHKGNFDSTVLSKIKTDVDALNINTPNLNKNIKQISTEFSLLKQSAADSNNVMIRALENAGKFLRYYLVGGFLVSGINALKDSIIVIKDLDTAMIGLKKVTDETKQTYDGFLKSANSTAKELAVSTTQVINATTEWVKAGYSLQEAQKLSTSTLIGGNVGDVSVEQMQSYLVAPLKAYNMTVEQSMDIVSKMNNISNKHAITVSDLGQAYNRAASMMAMANNSLDEFTALVTAAQARTQMGGDVIGNAFRTIALRITSMKDDETGEVIPRLAEDLANVGVTLKGVDGQLLSTYKIVQQLNRVWESGTLSQEKQLALLEKLAGKRQANILSAAIVGFSEAEMALENSINAGNSALEEQEKYLESIQAKSRQFSETVVGLWNNTINSDTIKFLIDVATGIVNIVDRIGILNIALLTTVGYFSLIKGMSLTSMITSIIDGVTKLSGVVTGLNLTLSSFAPLAIVSAILLLVQGVDWLSKSAERATEKLNKLRQEYEEHSKRLEELETQQQGVIDKLNELYKLRENNTITEGEKAELERLQQVNKELDLQIKYEQALKQIRGEEAENQALQTSKQKTETSAIRFNATAPIELTKTEKLEENIRSIQNLKNQIDTLKQSFENNQIEAEEYKHQLDLLSGQKTKLVDETETLIPKIEEENKAYVGNTKEGDKNRKTNEGLISSAKEWIIKLGESVNSQQNNTNATNDQSKANSKLSETLERLNKVYEDSKSNIDSLASKLSELEKIQEKVTDGYSYSYDEIEKIRKKYPELESAIYRTTDGWSIQEEAVINLGKSYIQLEKDHLQSQIDMSKKSLDDTKARISNIVSEIETVKNLSDAYKLAANLAKNMNVSESESSIFGALGGTNTYEEYAKIKRFNPNSLSANFDSMSSNLPFGVLTREQYNNLKAQQKQVIEYGKEVDAFNKLINDTQKKYEELTNGKVSGSGSKSSSSKSQTQTDQYTAQINQYQALENAIQDVNNQLETNKTLSDIADDSDKIRLLNERVELYKKQQQNLHALNEERRQEVSLLETQLSKLGFEASNGSIANYTERLSQLSGDTAKQAEEWISRYVSLVHKEIPDASKDWLNYELQIKNTSDEIEATYESQQKIAEETMQKQYDVISEVESKIVEIIKKRYESEREELDKTHKKRLEQYDEDLEEFRDYINQKISLLNDQYDTEDYQAQLQEEKQKALDIQADIDKYSLDDSIENRNKVIDLEKKLSEQKKVITDLETKRSREIRQKNLENQLSDYEDHIEDLKDQEDDRYEYQSDLLADSYTDEKMYAEARTKLLKSNMSELLVEYTSFEDKFGQGLSMLGNKIKAEFIDKILEAQQAVKDLSNVSSGSYLNLGTTTSSSATNVSGSNVGNNPFGMTIEDFARYKKNKKDWTEGNREEEAAQENASLRAKYGITSDAYTYDQIKNYYHDGIDSGFVGGKPLDSRHEEVAKLLKGELVINPPQLDNIIKNLPSNLLNFSMPKLQLPTISNNQAQQVNQISVEFNIDRVIGNEQAGENLASGLVSGLKRKGFVIANG